MGSLRNMTVKSHSSQLLTFLDKRLAVIRLEKKCDVGKTVAMGQIHIFQLLSLDFSTSFHCLAQCMELGWAETMYRIFLQYMVYPS